LGGTERLDHFGLVLNEILFGHVFDSIVFARIEPFLGEIEIGYFVVGVGGKVTFFEYDQALRVAMAAGVSRRLSLINMVVGARGNSLICIRRLELLLMPDSPGRGCRVADWGRVLVGVGLTGGGEGGEAEEVGVGGAPGTGGSDVARGSGRLAGLVLGVQPAPGWRVVAQEERRRHAEQAEAGRGGQSVSVCQHLAAGLLHNN
jgi:hypothetical protein